MFEDISDTSVCEQRHFVLCWLQNIWNEVSCIDVTNTEHVGAFLTCLTVDIIKSFVHWRFNRQINQLEFSPTCRDSQLQVGENYSDLPEWKSTIQRFCWLMPCFNSTIFKS